MTRFIVPRLAAGHSVPIMAALGLTNFLFSTPAFLLIDRFGRKPLLTAGALGMAVCMLAQATLT